MFHELGTSCATAAYAISIPFGGVRRVLAGTAGFLASRRDPPVAPTTCTLRLQRLNGVGLVLQMRLPIVTEASRVGL
jgi:hypothetical protein